MEVGGGGKAPVHSVVGNGAKGVAGPLFFFGFVGCFFSFFFYEWGGGRI